MSCKGGLWLEMRRKEVSMNAIELNFCMAYWATVLLLTSTVAAATLYAWWSWKNRDWLLHSRR
jgi:hypothetical protein